VKLICLHGDIVARDGAFMLVIGHCIHIGERTTPETLSAEMEEYDIFFLKRLYSGVRLKFEL